MSKHERKAEEQMKAGDKAQKKWFGGTAKFETAGEHYTKAGLSFKLAKNWDRAAEAYEKSSEMMVKGESENSAAGALTEAANMYLKSGKKEKFAAAMSTASEMYQEMNRLSTAAKLEKKIAEMYEQELEREKARDHYAQAAELFRTDNSSSAANTCFVKVALLLGEEDSYGKAAEIFDEVGKEYLTNNLLKFNARAQFMNACLCHLANEDKVACRSAYEEYVETDYQFGDSREAKLVEKVLEAFESQDAEVFLDAVSQFDTVSKLDPWRTKILLRIKEKITEGGEVDLS